MPAKLKTIKDWILWGVAQFRKAKLFYGHGTASALDDAAYLVLHALHLPLDLPSNQWNKKLSLHQAQLVFAMLNMRMKTKKPAAYITNEAWFAGLSFFVDERVLIPRSPMAEIIVNHFSPWIAKNKVKTILDLCTGSGCIAIACAKAFPKAKVVATDISTDALSVAKMNIKKHRLEKRVKLIQSDLFKNLKPQKFDVIITNPPYVDAEDMKTLPREFQYEPKLALAAGKNGLSVIDKILAEASNYLNVHGIMIVEVGNSAAALLSQYPHLPFIWLEFIYGQGEAFLINKNDLVKNYQS
jgi:ribosomal protein L3 glutamine methyltransferase